MCARFGRVKAEKERGALRWQRASSSLGKNEDRLLLNGVMPGERSVVVASAAGARSRQHTGRDVRESSTKLLFDMDRTDRSTTCIHALLAHACELRRSFDWSDRILWGFLRVV